MQIYSISQLNSAVRLLLSEQIGTVWLSGEISNFTKAYSGHWYFSLKDENAQIRAAMFKHKNSILNFMPQDGMQVIVKAEITLYEPRGDFQVIVHELKLAGEGLLQQKFEQLKQKLQQEGLFSTEHKQAIPHNLKTVGVITSKIGAAVHDILQILKRRDPSLQVIIYPSSVQGKEASTNLVKMIEIANQRQECEVIILGRGGGSLEDLWCFNEEIVARAIYTSKIPIISAVGHETDITISDFVADLRAPTPSAAAEIVSRDQSELLSQLNHQKNSLIFSFDHYFMKRKHQLENLIIALRKQNYIDKLNLQKQQFFELENKLKHTITTIIKQHQYLLSSLHNKLIENNLKSQLEIKLNYLSQLKQQLHYLIQQKLNISKQQFIKLSTNLDALSPLKIITRGYAMVTDQNSNKVISSVDDITINDKISIQLKDGKIIGQVIDKK